MGLLSVGTPLPWNEARNYADHVRHHGIEQFLSIYRKLAGRTRDCLLWGDELEYVLVHLDADNRRATLSLRAADILAELQRREADEVALAATSGGPPPATSWKPEYARFMLEATPGAPYGPTVRGLLQVEENMRLRRRTVEQLLHADERLMTITSFPMLGVGEFLRPHSEPRCPASRSLFIPADAIAPHARFPTLTANIRQRRGAKVAINVPVYKDEKIADEPFVDKLPRSHFGPDDDAESERAALPDHIYMDAMCFGMGCSCLQITFQACSIGEARYLYDQLTVITPIMLALTAAAPIYRGYLADVDCRWNIISASVDDRTAEERGELPLEHDRFRIAKSRYASVSTYISLDSAFKPAYNDVDIPMDAAVYDRLRSEGIDELLARHMAHLFIRDPLVVFRELLDQDDATSSDHFENIQSTNWQTMRFKPPPPNSPIGWRVEFRSMEIQMTEFENAAFAIFIALLTRAILSFQLDFYIPISKVDENMARAQKRDAVHTQKFHFRERVYKPNGVAEARSRASSSSATSSQHRSDGSASPLYTDAQSLALHMYSSPVPGSGHSFLHQQNSDASFSADDKNTHYYNDNNSTNNYNHSNYNDSRREMSLDEIVNGSAAFPGLIHIVDTYLNGIDVDFDTRSRLNRYLALVRRRASGECKTTATWMRDFVTRHPLYQHDSRVSHAVNYDLCRAMERIVQGGERPVELFGCDFA